MESPSKDDTPTEEKTVENKDESDENNEGVPTDTGWSWVIAISVFLNVTILVGFVRALSVLFISLREEYDQSTTVVSFTFTIGALTASISSVLTSNVIMMHYTVRKIAVTAAVFNSLGTIALVLAPNIYVFLFLQTVKGFAFGSLIVGPMSLIGYYFKKRRNLALSIGNAGFCIAFITFPPVTEILRVEYGLRGAFLILSAVELQLVAINMLLRPTDSYKKIYHLRMTIKDSDALHTTTKPLLSASDPTFSVGDANLSKPMHKLSDSDDKHIISNAKHKPLIGIESFNQSTCSVPERVLHENDLSSPNDHQQYPEIEIDQEDDNCTSPRTSEKEDGTKQISHPLIVDQCVEVTISGSKNNLNKTKEHQLGHSLSSSLRNLKSYPSHLIHEIKTTSLRGSHFSLAPADESIYLASNTSIANIALRVNKEGGRWKDDENVSENGKGNTITSCLTKIVDVSLFKNYLFRMMIMFVPISAAGNYLVIYMPVIAHSLGVSEQNAALFMMLSGINDLIVRIISGFVADLQCIKKSKMIACSSGILIIVCHLSRFITSDTFVVYAVMVGMFGGFRQNLMAAMITDYLGVEKMAKGYGLCAMMTTMFLSINYPIFGALFDVTGDFIIPLHYVGIWIFLAVIILLCEPVFAFLEKKRLDNISDDKQFPD